MNAQPLIYASEAKVRKAAKMAREIGIEPGGITFSPDGGITILDRKALASVNKGEGGDDWEDLDDEGGD